MNRVSLRSRSSAVVAAAVLLLAAQFALADIFKFGVISDTQDTIGTGTNSVATNIIAGVNAQFIARGVDLVVAVGDLGDNGSTASLQTRLAANADLTAAGIAFYGLRGNHEDNIAAQTYFQNNYIPSSSTGVTVSVAPDATSYCVTYKDTKLVLLDILTADSASAMTTATTWMNGQLSAADHSQAFVFQHKNLLGQNHKDNAFGSSNDANPTQQNAFYAALAGNGVRYDISGHDHMNHRSICTSPDGNWKVQEIITASDSTKYYTGGTPWSSRETCISDQQNKIGYYIYTVDGPKVTGEYWACTPAGNGDIPSNPAWTLQDKFGYSTNGKQFTIARGGSYTGVADQIAAGAGFRGTAMRILNGANGTTATAEGSRAESDDLNTGWAPQTAGLASDVLTLWGMNNGLGSSQTDTFVLSMNFASSTDPASGGVYLATRDANGAWVNAVSVDFGGTASFVYGAYSSSYGLGTYGVDPGTGEAWAVVNNNLGDYAVVPEPASLCLVILGGVAALIRRRRRNA